MGERDSKRKISSASNSITKPKKAKVAYDDEANESKAVQLQSAYQQVRVAILNGRKSRKGGIKNQANLKSFT